MAGAKKRFSAEGISDMECGDQGKESRGEKLERPERNFFALHWG
jgi:hypothetical protein